MEKIIVSGEAAKAASAPASASTNSDFSTQRPAFYISSYPAFLSRRDLLCTLLFDDVWLPVVLLFEEGGAGHRGITPHYRAGLGWRVGGLFKILPGVDRGLA